MLAVYLETSVVANGNVDGNDGVHVLAGMAEFERLARERFKERKKEEGAEKAYMKEALDYQMVVAMTEEDERLSQERRNEKNSEGEREVGNAINDMVVFHVAGSLIRRRKKGCSACYSTLMGSRCTAADQGVQQMTQTKDCGSLIYCSANLYALASQVEQSFLKAAGDGSVFEKDGFENILHDLCLDPLPPVGCDVHRRKCMADIIYDYLLYR